MKLDASTKSRFWRNVMMDDPDRCWRWTGYKRANRNGSMYGRIWINGKWVQAHWILLEDVPQKGKFACHHCDNPLCVNPLHIFIATPKENSQDMVRKGRHRNQYSKPK